MNKQILFGLWFLAAIGLAVPASAGIILSLDPVSASVQNGQPVVMDLMISGLGDGVAPSLGGFDIDVIFDDSLLAYDATGFGDPVLGDQLDVLGLGAISGDTAGAGTVNLYELSFDSIADLNLLQAPAFTLARLGFTAIDVGTGRFRSDDQRAGGRARQ